MKSIMRPDGVTDWFPVSTPPKRVGMYQVQTPGTCCRCCWEEADYREGGWWRYGMHSTLRVAQSVKVTHWRGLEKKAANDRVQAGGASPATTG